MSEILLPGSTESLRSASNQDLTPRQNTVETQHSDIETSHPPIPFLKEETKINKLKNFGSKISLGRNRVEPLADENRPTSAPVSSSVGGFALQKRPQTAFDQPFHRPLFYKQDESSIQSSEQVVKQPELINSDNPELPQKDVFNETAYIPYEYAHAMISRIVDDMKDMKLNHLSIVAKIENQYQSIENETQTQFETFLGTLQAKHQSKVESFYHVISILKSRLKSSNQNLEAIESLKLRNKELLLEKTSTLKAQKEAVQGNLFLPLANNKEVETVKAQDETHEHEEKIADDLQETEKISQLTEGRIYEDVANTEAVKTEEVDNVQLEDFSVIQRDQSNLDEQFETPEILEEKSVDFNEETPEDVESAIVKSDDITEFDHETEDDIMKPSPEDFDSDPEETDLLSLEAGVAAAAIINKEGDVSESKKSASGKDVSAKNAAGKRPKTAEKRGAEQQLQKSRTMIVQLRKQNDAYSNQIQSLERQIKSLGQTAGGSPGGVDKDKKRMEKQVKDLEKKLDFEIKKLEKMKSSNADLQSNLQTSTKELTELKKTLFVQEQECAHLRESAGAGAIALQQVPVLQGEVKELSNMNKVLTENYNSERILRKKYYNMVEDMKGKIRVYCRVRPMSSTEKQNKNKSAVLSPDDYTVKVEQARGDMKEFQFDQIFTEFNSQEDIFEDTNSLVQSAVDGYNVCIFAYGQTGSGKTYTMIGDKEQKSPGIAPRAFKRIFDLVEANQQKFNFQISCYMLELYNEKLIDLLAKGQKSDVRLDIKKDNKGMVFIQGSTVESTESAAGLYEIFSKGSESRHIASTNMNSESSRSHLVIGVVIESTNLATGAVTRGKLSLVDLAGSERVGKTGATATQLKEANSINKSLSALGDVISALSSEQGFIPYRNNKLTMLMQDSLGGNAKTLMFVNISPADYNSAESIISLTYASRVKLITNDASKNAETREVVRLKQIIAKLKAGESVDDVDS